MTFGLPCPVGFHNPTVIKSPCWKHEVYNGGFEARYRPHQMANGPSDFSRRKQKRGLNIQIEAARQ